MGSTLKFKISIDIPGTADLKPPQLVANCEIEFPGDSDVERAKAAYYKASYEKKLTEVLKEQVKGYAVPLKSMQSDVDKLTSAYEAVTNAPDPFDRVDQIKAAKKQYDELKAEINGYSEYLKGAVANTIDQQILIWHKKFEDQAEDDAEKKIKSDIKWKKVRHVVGIVAVGTLVVAGTALAVFGSVATFGALPIAIAAVGAGFVALGGISSAVKLVVAIRKNWDLEKSAIEKLSKDLEDVSNHLGVTQSKVEGLPKHLDDASRYCSARKQDMQEIRLEITKMDSELRKLSSEIDKMSDYKFKGLQGKQAQIKELTIKKAAAQQKLDAALALDKEMVEIFKKAEVLVGDLRKIPFTGCRSVMDSLKRYATFEGVMSGLDTVTSLGSAATSIG
jgi:hypothetical protein